MIRLTRGALCTVASLAVALSGMYLLASPSDAKDEPKEKPKVDCSKRANKKRAECRGSGSLNDNELFYAGYWLARRGDYETALYYLRQARNPGDVRFLTYTGYALRKLGHWDEAVGYYERALAADPSFVSARAYLGEAALERGDVTRAREQLAEIERRCGRTCGEFTELDQMIRAHEALRG